MRYGLQNSYHTLRLFFGQPDVNNRTEIKQKRDEDYKKISGGGVKVADDIFTDSLADRQIESDPKDYGNKSTDDEGSVGNPCNSRKDGYRNPKSGDMPSKYYDKYPIFFEITFYFF